MLLCFLALPAAPAAVHLPRPLEVALLDLQDPAGALLRGRSAAAAQRSHSWRPTTLIHRGGLQKGKTGRWAHNLSFQKRTMLFLSHEQRLLVLSGVCHT